MTAKTNDRKKSLQTYVEFGKSVKDTDLAKSILRLIRGKKLRRKDVMVRLEMSAMEEHIPLPDNFVESLTEASHDNFMLMMLAMVEGINAEVTKEPKPEPKPKPQRKPKKETTEKPKK